MMELSNRDISLLVIATRVAIRVETVKVDAGEVTHYRLRDLRDLQKRLVAEEDRRDALDAGVPNP